MKCSGVYWRDGGDVESVGYTEVNGVTVAVRRLGQWVRYSSERLPSGETVRSETAWQPEGRA